MNVVSFGGGTNSTAMIIGMYLHKIPIDLILFADTGGEQPHTYEFIETFNGWLEKHGLPQITSVQYHDKDGNRLTLEQECINSGTLPSIAYGFKRCSLKHKIGTQEKFCNNYQPCKEVWASGQRVQKYIGYDAGQSRRMPLRRSMRVLRRIRRSAWRSRIIPPGWMCSPAWERYRARSPGTERVRSWWNTTKRDARRA